MPGYTLSEGFAMEGGPDARRIVHLETGKTIELSQYEAMVVVFFCSSGEKGARPRPPPDAEKAQAFISELRRRGVLVSRMPDASRLTATPHLAGRPPLLLPTAGATVSPAEPDSPASADTAAPERAGQGRYDSLGLEDALPLFREDIRLTRQPQGGLYDAHDPLSDKRFQLYDFEVSVARMLRRPRRVGEVLDASARLGIPVTVATLRKFLRELDRYGFLVAVPPPAAAPAPSPAVAEPLPPRATPTETAAVVVPEGSALDAELRALFQKGLRALRTGETAEARGHFAAMLDQDPGNAEAVEMLALLEERPVTGSFTTTGTFVPGGGLAASGGLASRAAQVVRQLFTPPQTRGELVRRGIGVMGVVALLAAFAWPSSKPEGRGEGDPVEGAEAPVMAAFVGERVGIGPEDMAASRAEALSASIDRIWQPAAEVKSPRNGTLVWSVNPMSRVKKGQRVGTVRLDGAEDEEYVAAKAEVDQLRRAKKRSAAQRRELTAAQRKLSGIQRRLDRGVPLTVSAAGVLDHATASRARVREGELVGSIIDSSAWRVIGRIPSAKAAAGASCQVARYGTGQNAPCHVVDVVEQDGSRLVVAEVPAKEAAWLPKASPGTTRLTVTPP